MNILTHPLLWLAIATAAIAGTQTQVGQDALDGFLATIAGRGAVVGPITSTNELGVINDDPSDLAAAAGADLDTYALARMLSSEHGHDAPIYKLAVGWAAQNKAGGPGAIANLLLAGKGPTDGRFASQNAVYLDGDGTRHHAGKYASTAKDPREDDIRIALSVRAGDPADPTGGATNFFSPAAQDRGFASGLTGYELDADGVDAKWRARGLEPVDVPGIDPDRLSLYRPRSA